MTSSHMDYALHVFKEGEDSSSFPNANTILSLQDNFKPFTLANREIDDIQLVFNMELFL